MGGRLPCVESVSYTHLEYCPHTELPNLRGLHGIELKDFDLTGLAAVHPHLKAVSYTHLPVSQSHAAA